MGAISWSLFTSLLHGPIWATLQKKIPSSVDSLMCYFCLGNTSCVCQADNTDAHIHVHRQLSCEYMFDARWCNSWLRPARQSNLISAIPAIPADIAIPAGIAIPAIPQVRVGRLSGRVNKWSSYETCNMVTWNPRLTGVPCFTCISTTDSARAVRVIAWVLSQTVYNILSDTVFVIYVDSTESS